MCGRYKRRSDKQAIADALHVTGDPGDFDLLPDDDIAPTTTQPIVRENRDTGLRDMVLARWGFVPSWHKAGERLPANFFNARSEGVDTAPMWRRPFAAHRCLVPADSFFEWKKIRSRNNPKFEFALAEGAPFAFAGLWGAWKTPDGDWLQSFTILTTDPNAAMEPVHNRMPVILRPQDYGRWVSRDPDARPPIDLLRPFAPEAMVVRPAENTQAEIFQEPNSR